MSVEIVDVNIKVPKEGKDVADLLAEVVKKVKAKAGLSDYADLLDELMVAVEGAQKIPAELQSEHRNELVAYLGLQIAEELVPDVKPEEPVPA